LTEEWVSPVMHTAQRCGRRPPRACSAASRAATRADRLPIVPPWTKAPPASSGSPARSANQRSAWFSAYTAPDPSSHEPEYTDVAPTSMSNPAAALVGALGMNDR
jgi:hypothetical protein